MKSPDEQALAAELRALRPTPRPEFAAELDARAAAGFPRRHPGGTFARLAARFRLPSRRRLLLPASGFALAAIAVATVIVVSSEERNSRQPLALDRPVTHEGSTASKAPSKPVGHGSVQFEAVVPVVPSEAASHAAAGSASGGGMGANGESSAREPSGNSGPYASQASHRAVERSAELTLGADPADVRRAAGKVFETVHAYDGIVLESAITDGGEGEAGATFELLMPSAKVGDALSSFSQIAEVRSRQEQTADITAKTIGVDERLRDSRARIEGLLDQLADADTDAERVAAEAELREERYRAVALRANLADLQRRANLSHVSLKIESGEAGATPTDENGSWGVGDALGEAGHILEVAAGVALIGLAILAPFALLALLAWLTRRNTVRRSRERALG